MKLKFFIIILLLVLQLKVTAQPPEITYLGNVARDGYADNLSFGPFNIGFTFNFFGNNYTQFYVSSNGLITFGSGSNDNSVDPIPTAGTPNNFIAPFWDDLVVNPFGNILYTTIGAAPNRKLIVQFRNMGFYTTPAYMGSFCVVLYETTNKIQTQYRMIVLKDNTRAKGGTATIGIENIDGSAGVQYSYQNPAAVSTAKAISFTPSGITYTIDPNAIYEGVILTTNTTLPEPGITALISPANGSTVGVDNVFEWSASSNASSYSLEIATNPNLVGATSYNAGSSLAYNLTGLTPGITYYWTIFAYNATGSTWNEVISFTTSANPPLAAVPQTAYVELLAEKTISLNFTGGDAGAKTAIITVLPTQGQLYQYNAGVKGALISTVPTTVTDAGRNVIYLANGTSGNGAGNFSYKMNDGTGDSPAALITVNVSPPGIPNLLYVGKSTSIEMQFDRPMADPAGKQAEFTATVNGTPVAVSSLALKTGDNNSIIATLSTPLAGGETVLISYTAGTVASVQGGWLATFTNQSVTLLAQTITFTQSLTKKISDSPLTLTATAPGGALTYSSSVLSVSTIAGSVATLHAKGVTDVTARQAGNATYAPAKYVRNMTVAKGDQTITFSSLPDKTYGDSDFTLSGVAGSLLLVSYTSSNLAVATVSGNTVHIVGQGTTVITASQAGNTLWNAAPDVPQSLTVNKKNLTVTANGPAKIYGTALTTGTSTTNFTAGATGVGSEVVTSVTLTPDAAGLATATAAGAAYVVTPSLATGTGGFLESNYNITYTSFNGTVSKKALSVTATGPAKEYGTALTAGTSTTNFTAGATGVGSEVVTSVTLTPDAAGLATTTAVGASYVVTPSLATGTGGFLESNYNITYTPFNGTVSKKTLTATADNKTRIYGAVNPLLTITYAGFVGTDSGGDIDTPPVAATTALQSSDAGTYPITVSGGVDENYAFSYVDGVLTINKADQTITFSSLPDMTIGESDFTLSAVAGSLLLVTYTSSNTAVATVTGNTVHIVGAGTTTITASQAGDINYNAAPDVTQVLTVNKADQVITFSSLPDKTIGESDFTLSAVAGSLLLVTYTSSIPAVATVTGNTVHIVGVGTTTITASQGGDVNYNPAPDVSQTLNVFVANATVTLGNLTTVYNGLGQAATATTSPAGLNVDITYNGSATLPVDAGTYSVSATINDGSYHGSAAGTMVIGKADQTISFLPLPDKTFGESDFTLSAGAGSLLLVSFSSSNTAVATVTGNIVHIVGVGTTTITASQAGDANYNPGPDVSQTLSVYTANATVTLGNLTKTYNGLGQVVTATTSPAGLNVDITYNGSATLPVNAGNYSVVATINDGSYHGSAAGTMIINKADQTISFVPLADKTYGESDFTLSAGAGSLLLVTFNSSNPAVATVTANTVHIVGAGTTTITASQAGDANYNAAPDVPRTLTVNKAVQALSVTLPVGKLLVGEEFTLVAASTAGLPVLIESLDNTIATVTDNILKAVSQGTVQIRVYQPGDLNYLATEMLAAIEIYSTHKEVLHLFTPNNDGFNDYWELPELATWGKCDVKVFSRSGKLIFSDPDYNNLWNGTSNGSPVPEGAYYFIIETENAGMVKGTVNIVR